MKRFYKTAAVAAGEGGVAVLLDGKPLKTPAKAAMLLPTPALAQAVAAEWQAQTDDIRPMSMPMTRLVATAIDRVAGARQAATQEIARYGDTDLLAYRADGPADLVERQERDWQPMLDWFRARYDIQMRVTRGVIAVRQLADLRARIEAICESYDPFRLTGLHAVVTTTGSVILGLALAERRIGPDEAFHLSQLDELYQAELWGRDSEAEGRRTALAEELQAVARYFDLLDAR